MLMVDAVVALLTELYNRADAELHDPEVLGRKLLELQSQHDWGDISEEQYRTEYAKLLQLLTDLREQSVNGGEEEEEEEEEDEE